MSATDETAELLQRWHAGEETALRELLARYLPKIRAHVHRQLGDKLRKKEETADYVQEGVLEFLRYSPRFVVANGRQLFGLMVRIIDNMLRDKNDWYQAKRRQMDREQPLPSESVLRLDGGPASVTRPSEAAQRAESRAWVRLALELMSPSDREIVVLREYDGLDFPDIAKRLGITEPNARMRLSRALRRLGSCLRKLQAGDVDDDVLPDP